MKRTTPIVGLALIATVAAACGDRASLDGLAAAAEPTTTTTQPATTTPAVCRQALKDADAMIDLALAGLDKSSEGYDVVADVFGDVANFDLSGIDAATGQIRQIGQWFTDHADEGAADRAAYDKSKAECLNT